MDFLDLVNNRSWLCDKVNEAPHNDSTNDEPEAYETA